MIISKLRRVHRARPFRPFVLHLADGREIQVRHPELLAIDAADNTAYVIWPPTDFQVVELNLVTSIRRARGKPVDVD
jgi:hypothetical protein